MAGRVQSNAMPNARRLAPQHGGETIGLTAIFEHPHNRTNLSLAILVADAVPIGWGRRVVDCRREQTRGPRLSAGS